MSDNDPLLHELQQITNPDDDYQLAQRHAPQLRFDAQEPFLPLAVGYTVFRSPTQSPSSKFIIDPDNGIAIEYAIWWDWDIQHLYELEHVWLYLDADGTIIKVQASAHGERLLMTQEAGTLPVEEGRITLFSEPGKHGFEPDSGFLVFAEGVIFHACTYSDEL
jgi:putative hydrolase of the HAD superfamily